MTLLTRVGVREAGGLLWFSSSGQGCLGWGGFCVEGSVAEHGVEHIGASSCQGDDGLVVAFAALQDPGCSRGLNPPVSRSDLAM